MTNADVWAQELAFGFTTTQDRNLLDQIDVEPGQFLWLVRKYKAVTRYYFAKDFVDFVTDLQKEGSLPDELSCRAWNTNDPTMSALADELETLLGAWYPNETVRAQVDELRGKIRAAL